MAPPRPRAGIAAAAGALVGLLAALVLLVVSGPTAPDLETATRSLLPVRLADLPVAVVEGLPGISDDRSTTVSVPDRAAGVTAPELLDDLRATATVAGWTVVTEERAPGGTVVTLDREGLQARVTVFEGDAVADRASIAVSGVSEGASARWPTAAAGATGGALVGLAAGLLSRRPGS